MELEKSFRVNFLTLYFKDFDRCNPPPPSSTWQLVFCSGMWLDMWCCALCMQVSDAVWVHWSWEVWTERKVVGELVQTRQVCDTIVLMSAALWFGLPCRAVIRSSDPEYVLEDPDGEHHLHWTEPPNAVSACYGINTMVKRNGLSSSFLNTSHWGLPNG